MKMRQGSYPLFQRFFAHKDYGKKGLSPQVLCYLNSTQTEVAARFETFITEALREVRVAPLNYYQEKSQFVAGWHLSDISGTLHNCDFLACAAPDEAGIPCGTRSGGMFLLTRDAVNKLGLFARESPWDGNESVYRLSFELSLWRDAVCCVWASRILSSLLYRLNPKKALPFFGNDIEAEEPPADVPIGAALVFEQISVQEVEKFVSLCEKASFGSGDCEEFTASVFREWLKEGGIGMLYKYGMDCETAHMLISAAEGYRPRLDIGVNWNSDTHTYEWRGKIKNMTATGFEHRGAFISSELFFAFFDQATPKVREDLTRLLLRSGWYTAKGLALRSFR